MNPALRVAVVGIGLGATGCAGGLPSPHNPCAPVVLQDSVQAFASMDSVFLMAKPPDTLPKPFVKCVTLYAQAKDTLPKP